MRLAQSRLARLLALLLAMTLIAAACGDDDDPADASASEPGDGGSAPASDDYAGLAGTIDGSGASFPDAFYQTAISEFADVAPDLTVNYNSVGSGQGKKDFAAELVDFAGSDSLVKSEDVPADEFFYVPTVAAPITVSYNLDGVEGLCLGAETVAGIFQGDITSWDDDAIAEDNPDVDLPSESITIAHRADGSGTTSNFTKYLDKAAETWTLGSGDTVEWPSGAQAGQKNTGVAQIITSTSGAVGYVDLADANETGLTFAAIENRDGECVEPSLEATSAGLNGAEINDDLSYDPLDAEGADAYPITAPTYMLVRTSYADATVGSNVLGFVRYLLTEGQDIAETVDFARLPDGLRDRALAQLDKVQIG